MTRMLLVALVVGSMGLAGCPKRSTSASELVEQTVVPAEDLEALTNILGQVVFGPRSSALDGSSKSALTQAAESLHTHPALFLLVVSQVAEGEDAVMATRRAQAIRRQLMIVGVEEDRVMISTGEVAGPKPAAIAWSKNRMVEFRIAVVER